MNAAIDPTSLEHLHDILVAERVGFWPLAPGWTAVSLLFTLLVLGWLWNRYQTYRQNTYRRRALGLLSDMQLNDLRELPILLKQVALQSFPRNQVASLSGISWWRLLDESAGIECFEQGYGKHLDALAYEGVNAMLSDDERRDLVYNAAVWIRRHRAIRL